MTVSFKLVRESFRSRVTLDRPKLQILVEYLQGPFSHMQNRWTFRPAGDEGLRGRVLHRLRVPEPHAWHADGRRCSTCAFRRFAAAFEARADKVYGAQDGLGLPSSVSIASASSTERRRTSARPMSPKRRSR